MFRNKPNLFSSSCFVHDPSDTLGAASGFAIYSAARGGVAVTGAAAWPFTTGFAQLPPPVPPPVPPPPPPPSSSSSSSLSQFQPATEFRHHPRSHVTISSAMENSGAHDMAAQQEAAKDYRPSLEGPLVGEKTPSEAITQEYAKADQVFVEKTIALPQTFSHYRPIQGDGNCGWRAIGYSYFEKLVDMGDRNKVDSEVARITSLNHMLSTAGGYSYFEDWADEMTALLRELASKMGNTNDAHAWLLQRWNDSSVEGALIYYLRLLAAAYLKANASEYDPFVPDGRGIEAYCSQSIELVNREIEHLGIVALANILLKPAQLVLEVAYLDRSTGSKVNHHRFSDEANSQDPQPLESNVIYLLYRPDHYDILYRAPDDQKRNIGIRGPVSLQVNRASNLTQPAFFDRTHTDSGAFCTVDYSTLAMIPGFGAISGISDLILPPSSDGQVMNTSIAATQPEAWLPGNTDGMQASAPVSFLQPPSVSAPAQSSTACGPLPSASPMTMACGIASKTAESLGNETHKRSSLRTNTSPISEAGYPIRFSPVQLEYDECKSNMGDATFQVKTNTFKNSVWNRAHYGNPDFQPEEWNPEDENLDGRSSGKKKVKREKGH